MMTSGELVGKEVESTEATMPQQQSANEQEVALRRALIRVKPEYFS
jgi:hypothetical protein